jgi:threonylcarbamoyladenosine tRNA methylthiotransferase MtaB
MMILVKRTTVALDFLGCKLNQAETQELARELAAAGYEPVAADAPADVYVLNTCTVTHVADRKSRQLLRAARRRNPAARLVAVGCYADRAPEVLSGIEGVELVLGNDAKRDLVSLLGPADRGEVLELQSIPAGRTRSFLRVQDGCANRCAYCIVPLVRDDVISVPADDVVRMVNERAADGFREVVLTGTEIGTYRDGDHDLPALLARLLRETSIERLRLSSLQPPEISERLVRLWQDPRLCPHFHLSLQSGSDAVLARMGRRYRTEQYGATVDRIRREVAEAAVTTDVIVGFPGETDEEFRESYDFCEKIGFARIHVFAYSARPGTAAAIMPGQVAEGVKKARSKEMLALGEASARLFREGFTGRTMSVLFEQEKGGLWHGLTGNYLKVYVKSREGLLNELKPVALQKLYRDGLLGKPV